MEPVGNDRERSMSQQQKILVVDDDPKLRALLEPLLRSWQPA